MKGSHRTEQSKQLEIERHQKSWTNSRRSLCQMEWADERKIVAESWWQSAVCRMDKLTNMDINKMYITIARKWFEPICNEVGCNIMTRNVPLKAIPVLLGHFIPCISTYQCKCGSFSLNWNWKPNLTREKKTELKKMTDNRSWNKLYNKKW